MTRTKADTVRTRNAKRFLSVIMLGGRFTDICEGLGGWANDAWHELVHQNGDITMSSDGKGWIVDGPNTSMDIGISIVRLAHIDCDYENFLYAQVWDRRQDKPTWEYVLFFNTGKNEWVPEVVAAWSERPSYAEVGTVIDEWPVS